MIVTKQHTPVQRDRSHLRVLTQNGDAAQEYAPYHREQDRTAYLLRSYAASGPQRHREEAHRLADARFWAVEEAHDLPDYEDRRDRLQLRYPFDLRRLWWLTAVYCAIPLVAWLIFLLLRAGQ